MEPGILTQTAILFRDASLGWAPQIAPYMLTLLYSLLVIAWFFTALVLIQTRDATDLVVQMVLFLLLAGFTHFLITDGDIYVAQLFKGIKQLGQALGAPPLDPSAIAGEGMVIAEPILRSTADQGILSFAMSPISWVYALAGHIFIIAYGLLAFVALAQLILTYILSAATPFFSVFLILPFSRPLTLVWVRLVFGTMASLFITMLITGVMSDLGTRMHLEFETIFLDPGRSLTWADYASPFIAGIVLIGLFIWLPFKFAQIGGSFVPDWSGGRMVMHAGGAVVTNAASAVQKYQQGRQGQQGQLSSPSASLPNSGGKQSQPMQQSSWGRKS